jgi:hypothetical protein
MSVPCTFPGLVSLVFVMVNFSNLDKSPSSTVTFDMLCSQCYSIFLRKHSLTDSCLQEHTVCLSRTKSTSDCALCALLKARFIGNGKRNLRIDRAQDVALKYWLQDGDEALQEEPYWFHFEYNDARAGNRALNALLIPQQGDYCQIY